MKQPIDLRPDHAKIVHEIVALYLPAGVSVHVFGSRAKWTAKAHSDLDLALKGKEPLSPSILGDLTEAFTESDLPFRVDVVDWRTVAPSFQTVIDRDSVRLTVPLGEVVKLLSGGTPSKSNRLFWNGNIPWLTPKDMGRWQGETEAHVTEAAIGNGTRLAPENSVFIAVRGMSLHNEIRIVRSARPIAFNQDVKALAAGSSIDPDFLYYALGSVKPLLLGMVSSAGHGTGVLETDRLRSLAIPSLPMGEQRAIASVLSALDDKIELNRRMNETLEQMAQAIFKDWFIDFGPVRRKQEGARDPIAIMGGLVQEPAPAVELAALFPDVMGNDGLPEDWQLGRIDTMLELVYGKSLPKTLRKDGDIPVYGSGGINGTHNESLVRGPGIVVGRKGTVGSLFWVQSDFFPIDTVFFVRPKETYELNFLWFMLQTLGLTNMNTDAAVPGLNRENVYRLEFPAAPENIRANFSSFSSLLRAKIEINHLEACTLAETRDYLLPKLISSEVRVRDAETIAEAAL